MNVGDYVRTNDGYIYKIKKIPTEYKIIVDAKSLFGEELEIQNNEIIKSSPNIIDLIEVGDYVNGEKVVDKYDYIIAFDGGQDGNWYIRDDEIKSIVTKEQFESMEYKVGE